MTTTYTPQPSSLYGRLIGACDVEQALRARLDARLGDYLTEVERQHGLAVGTLVRPRAYVVADRWPEDQLPAIVVESPGTTDLPAADGQGRYAVRFEVTLTILVAAARDALELAKLYALALRAIALQQPSALFMGVDWVAERYPRPDLEGGRTFYSAEVALEVQVPDVTNRHQGPPDDPDWPEDPGGPTSPAWPVAATADTAVEKTPTDQPLED